MKAQTELTTHFCWQWRPPALPSVTPPTGWPSPCPIVALCTPCFPTFIGSLDVDVSAAVDLHGVVEQGISRVWHKILEHGCLPPTAGGKPGLVVDVGGNFGWYTLLAAAAGCRVIVWEPVSYFAGVCARKGAFISPPCSIRPVAAGSPLSCSARTRCPAEHAGSLPTPPHPHP